MSLVVAQGLQKSYRAGEVEVLAIRGVDFTIEQGGASFIPEVIYTGITDLELRGRLALLAGGRDTDFGERQSDWRVELRARYHF